MPLKYCIVLAFLFLASAITAQENPNILVIITDQHSGSILSQRGYSHIETPGIDKIADQGVVFTRSYCTYPVCTASRKSFLTGMMPGKATPTNYTSIATLLADNGYKTAYMGKWHVGSTDIDDVSDWHGFQIYQDGHQDTEIKEWTTNYIKQEHSKPFFLISSFLNPHDCCELARNIAGANDSYHDGAVVEDNDTASCPPLPHNFNIPENEAEGISARRNQDPGDKYWRTNPYKGWTESQWRQYMYGYDRLVEKVDAHVKEVVDELETQGLLDNTIIIYTSDHGDGHASHQWTQKKNFYEEVVNIPFIVSWKGKTKAGVIDKETLVSNGLDLYPTILKMAGIDIPEYLPGENLSGSFLAEPGDASPVDREYVVSEITQKVYKSNTPGNFEGRMVVTDRFKYFLFNNGANKEQLFDLENDPGELKAVTYDPEYHDDLMNCRSMLREWISNNDDDLDMDEALFTIKYDVQRLNNGDPIITEKMFIDAGASEREGEDLNGPSVIRIPDWISSGNRTDPTAKYYCYFAHHGGEYIRMAWAEDIEGPWHLYDVGFGVSMGERGVLDLGNDVINLDNGIVIPNNHLASPDVLVDDENQRIILYFHSGSSTYVNGTEVDKQLTYVSFAPYGLEFYDNIQPVILGSSYFRVFDYDNKLYSLTNSGTPYKAPDIDAPWSAPVGWDYTDNLWEKHPNNPFQADITGIDGIPSSELRVRHTAVRKVDDELHVFYSRRGDLMENIQMSTIDLSAGNWTDWDASYPPCQILQSAPGWEGGDLTPEPSEKGGAPENVNQLRDPYVLEDTDGSLYLFYAGRGEDAIGLAQLFEAHAEVKTMDPLKDTYVQGGSSANNNYGTEPKLAVNHGSNPEQFRKTYLQFDLKDVYEVDQALVRLYANSEMAAPITTFEASIEEWTETGITWNNAPEIGSEISTTQLGSDMQYYDWDVTEYVKINPGEKITLAFYDKSASNKAISFSSKEGANSPELRVIVRSCTYKFLPPVPTPLFARGISSTEINLSWTDNAANEEGFIIERKTEGGGFTEIADLDANTTSYTDDQLESLTAYTYRILAYNGEGDSEYSDEAVATTFSSDFITTSYSVTADTYVRGGTYANDNFGAEEELRVKTGTKENYFRNTLVKFDLSEEDLQHENVMRAVLRLYAKRAENCDVIASEIDNAWTELDVTWSSAPASGDKIASATITTDDVYYEWDITSLVHSKLQQDKIVSVCLQDHQGSNANLRFNSKEAADNHPELVLSMPNQSNSFISFNENLLQVYPNPANNVLNITLPNGIIGDISIYSLIGKLVHEEKNLVGENKIRIDHLDNSIYLLQAKGEFGTIIVKFVKAL